VLSVWVLALALAKHVGFRTNGPDAKAVAVKALWCRLERLLTNLQKEVDTVTTYLPTRYFKEIRN
jgi:hypothetical protein